MMTSTVYVVKNLSSGKYVRFLKDDFEEVDTLSEATTYLDVDGVGRLLIQANNNFLDTSIYQIVTAEEE